MKTVKTEQFRIIHNTSPEIYTEELNAAMRELRAKGPQVEFHQTDPTWCVIRYTETEKVPETLADEYELKGLKFRCCEDCNQIQGTDDGRRRRFWCELEDCIDRKTPCCEEFYRKLERKEYDWRIME